MTETESRLFLALNNMLIKENNINLSHDNLLDHKARLIGFSSFSDFIHQTSCSEKFLIGKSIEIRRRICQIQLPDPHLEYFFFKAHSVDSFSYRSMWVGKDKNGTDLNIPATVSTHYYIEKTQSIGIPRPLVINDLGELLLWTHHWLGEALVEKDLAKEHFFEFF